MSKPGRQSAADLSVATNITEIAQRPEPPEGLTSRQIIEWKAITNRLPADWFTRETLAMLTQLVGHIEDAEMIETMLQRHRYPEEGKVLDMGEYNTLLISRERESRAIMALSRSMRITQQATYDPERRKGSPGKKPWDK